MQKHQKTLANANRQYCEKYTAIRKRQRAKKIVFRQHILTQIAVQKLTSFYKKCYNTMRRAKAMNRLVIGIAGGTGSGKTTVAKKISAAFGKQAVILSHDYYYKDRPDLPFEERKKLNYDHPDSLETSLLVEHVKQLKAGQNIKHPTYDFCKHKRNAEWEETRSAELIIVEGILIFTDKELCDLCDIKLFVDTDADIRFIRRLRRDVNRRGRSMESVIAQYTATVKPMHEQFVEPSKVKADLIIPEGGNNVIAISMICDAIKKKMRAENDAD